MRIFIKHTKITTRYFKQKIGSHISGAMLIANIQSQFNNQIVNRDDKIETLINDSNL